MATKQRGQIIPRGPGKWLLRVYRGTNAKGGLVYSSKVHHGTHYQAQQALTQMLREVDTRTFIPRSALTVAEYLEEWVSGKIDVAPRTLDSYRRLLLPPTSRPKRGSKAPKPRGTPAAVHFGGLRLTDLDTLHCQRWVTQQSEAGLSPRTVDYGVTVLSMALKDALTKGLLVKNPCLGLTLPRKASRPPTVLSVEQVRILLQGASQEPLGALWAFLLGTGCRPQEALALLWSDLDLTEGWVSIRRVVVDDGHGKQTIEERAKADSQRRLGLAEVTVKTLKTHRARQAEHILAVGNILATGQKYDRQGLVFANSRGGILDHNTVRRAWKGLLKRLELPEVRLYDTRHTHLTHLLASGTDIAWVASRAGHKDIKMTRDHYAHVLPETHREMGKITDRLLTGSQG